MPADPPRPFYPHTDVPVTANPNATAADRALSLLADLVAGRPTPLHYLTRDHGGIKGVRESAWRLRDMRIRVFITRVPPLGPGMYVTLDVADAERARVAAEAWCSRTFGDE